MAKRPADVSMFSKPSPFRKAGSRAGKKASEFTLVTESIQHGSILPTSLYGFKGCCTKQPGMKSCQGPPRPGMVELVFVKREAKAKKGAPPAGPALRFCTGRNTGVVVPVKDPREAKRIAQEYQACVGDKKSKQKSCLAAVKS